MPVRLRAAVPLLLAVALFSAACGARTSNKDLAVLLRSATEAPSGSDAAPAGAAPSPDASTAAGAVTAPGAVSAAPGDAAAAGGGGATASAGGTAAVAGAASKANAPSGAVTGAGKPSSAAGPGVGGPATAATPAGGQRPAQASAAASATPQACSGSEPPIIIGSVGSYSGVMGSIVGAGPKAVQAWAAWVNARGGVNCHQVKYVVADDGGDAARNQSLVRRLVEQEKVIAFVFTGAPVTAQASVAYLNEKQVPEIGQEGGHMFTYESPMTFPVGAAAIPIQRLTMAGGARLTVPQGRTKAAIITCQEVEYCNVADKTYKERAGEVGYQAVYNAKVTFTQPDFTSICVSAQNAGADVLLIATDANSHQRIMSNCAKVNYHPTDVLTTIQMSADFEKDPNMEGTVIVSNNVPWFLAQHPAVAEYAATMKKFAPAAPSDATAMNGWASAKAFDKAMKGITPQQAVTSKDVLAGLYALNGEELGGLVAPLYYTPGKPARQIACGWATVVSKGKFTSDGQRFCVKGLEP
jgi:branched-chain amino acid transport system substrate-binding protein